jgi:hypothetical protein
MGGSGGKWIGGRLGYHAGHPRGRGRERGGEWRGSRGRGRRVKGGGGDGIWTLEGAKRDGGKAENWLAAAPGVGRVGKRGATGFG